MYVWTCIWVQRAQRNSMNTYRRQYASLRYAGVRACVYVKTRKTLKALQLLCRFLPWTQQSLCAFHRELLNQCFHDACVRATELTFTFLPNLSLHLCAMEVSIRSSLEMKKRDFVLCSNGVTSDFLLHRVLFFPSWISRPLCRRSRIAVYKSCPFGSLPAGRKKTSMETGTMCCSVQWLAGNIGAY